MFPWIRAVGTTFVVCACAGDVPPPAGDGGLGGNPDSLAPPSIQLVDPTIPPAVAGNAGWNYQQTAQADLNGDGELERVVLTARVELYRGRPAWDDGQPWQVYVEAADGKRTHVYAQRLQLGTLMMRVGLGDGRQAATVVLLEQLPDQLSVYEVSYLGPGRVSVAERFRRVLDPRGETASPQLP